MNAKLCFLRNVFGGNPQMKRTKGVETFKDNNIRLFIDFKYIYIIKVINLLKVK